MEEIIKLIQNNQDKNFGDFVFRLIPNIDRKTIIGVRSPILKNIAKKIVLNKQKDTFLNELPHQYFEENMVHSYLINLEKDYQNFLKEIKAFLPYIDNWEVSDVIKTKAIKNHELEFLNEIKKWLKSKNTYVIRFALSMLMTYFLDANYQKYLLELPLKIKNKDYYVKMMISYFYATNLAKHYEDTLSILKENKLDTWIHNKTIQKARESFRINNKQKAYLNTLKRK